MRTTLLTTAASLLALDNARIVGFATPDTVAPDSTVKLEIIAQNDIQASQDVAFSFDLSNIVENITHFVHIPATTQKGAYVLSGAQFSLFGASSTPTLINYVANVSVGEFTSTNYVFSTRVGQ
ncbi:hypothetical protein M409DRAFT_24808 [Zasmidium cellare ATCC 36951]|uniref:Uncharacterized protein n=1 Tax=Zasmidium cellare ATCC 36951 TaxID=1080233 RepID=A0A6A6CCV5_ZASCE|nr:uncharacterized protein M409DRAFT_24808 [Zasmidium cellare ATCC 36951]KAF2164905.1 hypothetical protein M409DRAFT_24808 [Zasmidium cellare ATCC 36951]